MSRRTVRSLKDGDGEGTDSPPACNNDTTRTTCTRVAGIRWVCKAEGNVIHNCEEQDVPLVGARHSTRAALERGRAGGELNRR